MIAASGSIEIPQIPCNFSARKSACMYQEHGVTDGARARFRGRRKVTAVLTVGIAALISLAQPALVAESPLDRVLSIYQTGDRDVVARTFRQSSDFQTLRLADERQISRWLGTWQRDKAALLLELANTSSLNAPVYTL